MLLAGPFTGNGLDNISEGGQVNSSGTINVDGAHQTHSCGRKDNESATIFLGTSLVTNNRISTRMEQTTAITVNRQQPFPV